MSDVTVDGLEGASNSSGNYEMPALVSDGGDVTEANTTVNLSAVDFLGDDSFAMTTEMGEANSAWTACRLCEKGGGGRGGMAARHFTFSSICETLTALSAKNALFMCPSDD